MTFEQWKDLGLHAAWYETAVDYDFHMSVAIWKNWHSQKIEVLCMPVNKDGRQSQQHHAGAARTYQVYGVFSNMDDAKTVLTYLVLYGAQIGSVDDWKR